MQVKIVRRLLWLVSTIIARYNPSTEPKTDINDPTKYIACSVKTDGINNLCQARSVQNEPNRNCQGDKNTSIGTFAFSTSSSIVRPSEKPQNPPPLSSDDPDIIEKSAFSQYRENRLILEKKTKTTEEEELKQLSRFFYPTIDSRHNELEYNVRGERELRKVIARIKTAKRNSAFTQIPIQTQRAIRISKAMGNPRLYLEWLAVTTTASTAASTAPQQLEKVIESKRPHGCESFSREKNQKKLAKQHTLEGMGARPKNPEARITTIRKIPSTNRDDIEAYNAIVSSYPGYQRCRNLRIAWGVKPTKHQLLEMIAYRVENKQKTEAGIDKRAIELERKKQAIVVYKMTGDITKLEQAEKELRDLNENPRSTHYVKINSMATQQSETVTGSKRAHNCELFSQEQSQKKLAKQHTSEGMGARSKNSEIRTTTIRKIPLTNSDDIAAYNAIVASYPSYQRCRNLRIEWGAKPTKQQLLEMIAYHVESKQKAKAGIDKGAIELEGKKQAIVVYKVTGDVTELEQAENELRDLETSPRSTQYAESNLHRTKVEEKIEKTDITLKDVAEYESILDRYNKSQVFGQILSPNDRLGKNTNIQNKYQLIKMISNRSLFQRTRVKEFARELTIWNQTLVVYKMLKGTPDEFAQAKTKIKEFEGKLYKAKLEEDKETAKVNYKKKEIERGRSLHDDYKFPVHAKYKTHIRPNYALYADRRHSCYSCGAGLAIKKSPRITQERLAEAGFFYRYTDKKNDGEFSCYSCDGKLKCFESNDDIFKMHKKNFATCKLANHFWDNYPDKK